MFTTLTNALFASLRIAVLSSIFLGPFAGLALYKSDYTQQSSNGAGFVILMSLQRG